MPFIQFNPPEDYSIEELQKRLEILKETCFLLIIGKKRSGA